MSYMLCALLGLTRADTSLACFSGRSGSGDTSITWVFPPRRAWGKLGPRQLICKAVSGTRDSDGGEKKHQDTLSRPVGH